MALETLKNLSTLGLTQFMRDSDRPLISGTKEIDWDGFDKMREQYPICIDDSKNMISFKIQDGPIKENGKNGCQVIDMILVAKTIIEQLNIKYPCRENSMSITKLDEALMWQNERTADREARNVEGTSQV